MGAMLPALLFLLFLLGLCLGNAEVERDDVLPAPVLRVWPGPVVGPHGDVTFVCWSAVPNVTFMLGKLQDAGYRPEQRVVGQEAQFLLRQPGPAASGTYFCAYRKAALGRWSETSPHVQLQVTGHPDDIQEASSSQSHHRTALTATFSCLCIVLLFLAIILIYRRTRPDPAQEEATSRTSHSESSAQESIAPAPGLPAP